MNNLCCKLNPDFLCKACGMTVCSTCYTEASTTEDAEANELYIRRVEYHEKGAQCPEGANEWLNRALRDESSMVFGKRPGAKLK